MPSIVPPSADYHRVAVPRTRPLPKGLDALAQSAVGLAGRASRRHARLTASVDRVVGQAPELEALSDRHLRERLQDFRERVRRARLHPARRAAVIPDALAGIREAARRTVGLEPFPVQLLGALAMDRGMLAEMATGEGKTLTAALAATLAGWSGAPCHIVTVNDYLAQRDAEWFAPFYRFCGVSVGYVTSALDPAARRKAYASDVCYTTSKELLADFLRDRLHLARVPEPERRLLRALLAPRSVTADGLVMRGLHTALVDEADSVLIDEAVTPLIIARRRPNPLLRDACAAARAIAEDLQPGRDYTVDLRYREIELRPEGEAHVDALAQTLPAIWRGAARRKELIQQALTARELFLRGRNYVIQDEKAVIVDEFTGRIMPNRTWSEGLHQAIEAKERLDITEPDETLARLSFQRFFRLFSRLAGMTGTAREATGEFWRIYRLPVLAIPTHRPCIREVAPDRLFLDAESKWAAVATEVGRIHAAGRPVLVGTRSVAASEALAGRLEALGLEFNLLNAVRHAEEARIVAEAGLEGRITIATNMAGRGTDIKLGRGVAASGGLHVLATERHESGRIDRQLFGRCARQGDPGSAQAFVSLEDEILVRFLSAPVRAGLARALAASPASARRPVAAAVRSAQAAAQRLAYRQRRSVLATDTWLDESLSFAPDAA